MEVNVENIEKGIKLPGIMVKDPLLDDIVLPVYVATYVLAEQG